MKVVWKLLFAVQAEISRLRKDERGQALSEYAIVIGVIAVLIIATLVLFKDALIGVFNKIIGSLNGV